MLWGFDPVASRRVAGLHAAVFGSVRLHPLTLSLSLPDGLARVYGLGFLVEQRTLGLGKVRAEK